MVDDRHAQQVFARARARVGEHAGDLTAEVLARAWLSRRRFRDQGDGSAFPWLCGIARNVLLDSLIRVGEVRGSNPGAPIVESSRYRGGFPLLESVTPCFRESGCGVLHAFPEALALTGATQSGTGTALAPRATGIAASPAI